MYKSGPSKTGITLQAGAPTRPEESSETLKGLVLDEILTSISDTRRIYALPQAKFGLKQIEREAAVKAVVEGIIRSTVVQHAPDIYAKPYPLLDKIYNIRRGKRINKPGFYSGRRIVPAHAAEVLRLVLESALQTIIQLPKKDPPLKHGTRELKQLAIHCDKLAKEIDGLFRIREVRNRASVYFRQSKGSGLDSIFWQADELQRTAETVRSILANTCLVRPKTDSPNPQVRFALYLIGWFEASSGRKQYAPFKALVNGAFAANDRDTPAWVHRLEIEMTRRRARRKAWARSITV